MGRFLAAAILSAAMFPPALARSAQAKPPDRPPPGARATDEGWFAPVQPERASPPLPEEVTRAFVIPIREDISSKTFDALKRKAQRLRRSGAQLLILDMDTWGGGAMAALDIARFIKTDLKDVHTVCYVRTRAISAGALIAMACHEIVMTPVGAFGDAAPVSLIGSIEGVEREKLETVIRNEFAESARLNGYSIPLAESMVSIHRQAWLIRHKKTAELRYVDPQSFQGQIDGAPGAAAQPSAEWQLLKVVVSDRELLTMSPGRARELGFVRTIVEPGADQPLEPLLKHFHVTAEPVLLGDTWSERIVEFLLSPAVMGLLFFAGVLCAYIEVNTPGFGLFGGIAIACFALLFGSRFLVGMANWWEIAIFVLGLALILLEVFVIPGFGFVGILGILCCLAGLVGMLVPNDPGRLPIPSSSLDWEIFSDGLFALGAAFVASIIAGGILSRYLPRMPVASRLVLAPAASFAEDPVAETSGMRKVQVGDVGVVEHFCRPVGKVRFEGQLLDAVSEGGLIEPGRRVRVLQRDGNRLVVRPEEGKAEC